MHAKVSSLLLVLLILFHGFFVSLEIFKIRVYSAYLDRFPALSEENANASLRSSEKPARVLDPVRLRPKRWESTRIYRAIGIHFLQSSLLKYSWWARGSSKQQESEIQSRNVKPKFTSPKTQDLVQFAGETVTSELVHGACAAANLFVMVALWIERLAFVALICGFMLLVDLAMVMLQRYNRARIFELVDLKTKRRRQIA